jgi:hypothetical protein
VNATNMNITRILNNQLGNTELRAEAEQELRGLLHNLADNETVFDGSNTYDDNNGRAEKFMVAGGGPSAWAVFVQFAVDDVTGYLEVAGSTGTTIVHIPDVCVIPLRDALRADTKARNAR